MSLASSIAADAQKYRGRPYKYGGGSPAGWDCSGFVSYVLGHDLGLTLPGGVSGFSGATHGPVVLQYATWSAASTVPSPPQPGDLCVWPGIGPVGHIGIAVSPTTMISALNPKYGTAVTPIAGFGPKGVPVIYRRLNGAGTASATTSSGSGASLPAGCTAGLVMLPVLIPLALLRSVSRKAPDDQPGPGQPSCDDQVPEEVGVPAPLAGCDAHQRAGAGRVGVLQAVQRVRARVHRHEHGEQRDEEQQRAEEDPGH